MMSKPTYRVALGVRPFRGAVAGLPHRDRERKKAVDLVEDERRAKVTVVQARRPASLQQGGEWELLGRWVR